MNSFVLSACALCALVVGLQGGARAEEDLSEPAVEEAQQVTPQQAARMKQVISHAQGAVRTLIQKYPGHRGHTEENDPVVINLLLQTQSMLNTAGDTVDNLTTILQTPPINVNAAVATFVRACVQSATARSHLARARLATFGPPNAIYTGSEPEFTDILTELQGLRSPPPSGVGCP